MSKRSGKKRKDSNPRNKHNWALICAACGAEFPEHETIDLQMGHFQEAHPDLDKPHFNLTWVGVGPPPKKGR